MKTLLFTLTICFFSTAAFCQLQPEEYKALQEQEDSMKTFSKAILRGRSPEERIEADSIFTRMFVKALRTKYSFDYPFDSLVTISKVEPPDKSFRIFTWQLFIDEATTRQHGAIQMKTEDGSLKLFPLIDRSPVMKDEEKMIGDNFNWVGAVYYNIVENEANGRKYYTLLGFDENDFKSNRKIIDMLTFHDGKPVFGGHEFMIPGSILHPAGATRYIMVYKKNASPKLNYDPEMKMIVIEHMISETNEPEKKFTYIPDGDYEGLVWKDGKWIYIKKIFNQITPEGKEPVPHPILDEKGNVDQTKLKNNSNQNL